ncbi:YfkD family protein [Bacillus carboniphilus]|uniref:YfkD family protein n=1 Tax=Bacillus carboniphilus TaxID=86663 RepID=A0ABY9JT20_9BACI|nr:YfkD famly protein [Bacillus carboniphilus]WLR42529.1 YfkD family protein [Bacillus carboniphilus]
MKKIILTAIFLVICLSTVSYAEEKNESKDQMDIPNSVMDISKDNTYPNPTDDLPRLQPSELAQELIESSEVKIENPDLILQLNESSITTSPVAIGYRATIYLGHWALRYDSNETATNWEYKKINTNFTDNRGAKTQSQMHYTQKKQEKVTGGLTAKVPYEEDVKKMMLQRAMEKTELPLSFETVIGTGTKKDQVYNVPVKKVGYLYGYAPAVNEKGKVTYGEVYLRLKGSKKEVIVKNVTQQGIGAWIPIQDHVSFGFVTSDQPK